MELGLHIQPLNEAAMAAARERQAKLAKPPGSLGRLEDLSVQLAGITGKVHNEIEKKPLLVFASDNGVIEEDVSSAPKSVTLMQTINLTRHKTGASTLCKLFGCRITVCDVHTCGVGEIDFSKRCIYKIEEFAYNHPDPIGYFQAHREAWQDRILILQDIFCGVVPMGG